MEFSEGRQPRKDYEDFVGGQTDRVCLDAA